MKNCLKCGKELTHFEGRKQKSFCNVNCRNKYFYAKRSKLIKAALNGNGEYKEEQREEVVAEIPSPPESNAAQKRIDELQKELKSPPKNPLIGLKNWIKVRENEIKELQKTLNPPI